MSIDLHTHTTASDGTLAPAALIAAAAAAGVEVLSITDHDVIAAYAALDVPAGLTLVPGIEFSATHRRLGVHVLGLGIAFEAPPLQALLTCQRAARHVRAERIAERLARRGHVGALEGALAQAGEALPGRPHFAAWLVAIGACRDAGEAFQRYLGETSTMNEYWPTLDAVCTAIRAAGGVAVLAHPGKYGLTRTRLDELVGSFRHAGGEGIEVLSGQQAGDLTATLAGLARRHGLLVSQGSDFHRPGQPWAALGRVGTLPGDLTPVWSRWA